MNYWLNKTEKNTHYLNNDYLQGLILNHQRHYSPTCSKYLKYSTGRLSTALRKLIKNIMNYAKFTSIDEEDATIRCFDKCSSHIENFDPKKGKAFNYFTTIVLNELRTIWEESKKKKRK